MAWKSILYIFLYDLSEFVWSTCHKHDPKFLLQCQWNCPQTLLRLLFKRQGNEKFKKLIIICSYHFYTGVPLLILVDEKKMTDLPGLSVQALSCNTCKKCSHLPQGVRTCKKQKEKNSFIKVRYFSIVLRDTKLKWPSQTVHSYAKASKKVHFRS